VAATGSVILAMIAGPLGARTSYSPLRQTVARGDRFGINRDPTAFAAFQLSLPDARRAWALLQCRRRCLWIVASGFGCLRVWSCPDPCADLSEARDCLIFIIGLSVPLSALLVIMLRRGCPLQPGIDRRDRGLAAAAAAATLLNFFHPFRRGGTTRWHCSPAVSLVIAGNSALSGPACSPQIFSQRRNALAGLLELGRWDEHHHRSNVLRESPAMSRSRIVIALSAGITSLSLAGAASAEDPGNTHPGGLCPLEPGDRKFRTGLQTRLARKPELLEQRPDRRHRRRNRW